MLRQLGDRIELYLPIFLENLIAAIIPLVIVFIVYRILDRALQVFLKRWGFPAPLVVIAHRTLRWVAIAVGLAVVLQVFGILENAWSTFTAIIALIAVGFVAVWSVLSNVSCSVILLVTRPFRIGDTIEITNLGIRGKMVNITFLHTTLCTEDNRQTIQVPNNLFFQHAVRREQGQATIDLDKQIMEPEDAKV